MHLKERITAPGPKKILALDGGGIRGILTLEILVRLEATLREKLGRQQDFVLADFFDFFAGTSTGAIIAAGLAMGMPVAQ
ncbi:MAG: patatin-like phospholipase family protein, partial [Calditrichaeota bacterium]|nr:patatin-like phospholipase family protein [Calditrichota bacterium]